MDEENKIPTEIRKSSFKPVESDQFQIGPRILSRNTLQGASFTSVGMLIEAIEAFVASWNQDASPFEWTNRPGPVRAVALEKRKRSTPWGRKLGGLAS